MQVCPRCHSQLMLHSGLGAYLCSRWPHCVGTLHAPQHMVSHGSELMADLKYSLRDMRSELSAVRSEISAMTSRIGEVEDSYKTLHDAVVEIQGEVFLTEEEAAELEKEKERQQMAEQEAAIEKKGRKKSAKEQAAALGGAIAEGVAMGATDKVGDIFVSIAQKLGQNSPVVQSMLEEPLGRELLKMLMATSVLLSADNAPGIIPASEHVARAARLQVKFSSAKLSALGFTQLGDELKALAQIGAQLAALPSETAEHPNFEKPRQAAHAR